MMRVLLFATVFLGCGPPLPHFDLDQPIAFDFEPEFERLTSLCVPGDMVKKAMESSIRQIGSSVVAPGQTTNPPIRVQLMPDDPNEPIDSRIQGQARAGFIQMRKSFFCNMPEYAVLVMNHELGHALGAGHVPCQYLDEAVMCADSLRLFSPYYIDRDIAAICAWNYGGVCPR